MRTSDFDLVVLGVKEWDVLNDNLDVEVRFSNGQTFTATFFTLANIKSILENYKTTGECSHGLYFWSSEMIIVTSLEPKSMRAVVDGLLRDDEFDYVFKKVPEEPQLG